MESKLTEKSTPKKTMHNILYEQVQGRFPANTFSCDSPFRMMPNFSTPPSRCTKIFNPFEANLSERLHLPVFSPSVFTKEPDPKAEEKFKWTIESISTLKPADIDVRSVDQHVTDHDSALESTAQEKIDTFFNEKIIVPSPSCQAVNTAALISDINSPEGKEKSFTDACCQTTLSLPPVLPKQVEEVLKPYFNTSIEGQPNENQVDAALYNTLFAFEEHEHGTPGSVQTSPALSVALSPIQFSPFDNKEMGKRRNFESMGTSSPLEECDVSPVGHNISLDMVSRDRRSGTRLNFSSHMSVDNSALLVPDNVYHGQDKSAVMFESFQNCVPNEVLSDSAVNWDMEYKHISLESPSNSSNSSSNGMDVSTSNTPRSKIFTSQRKKLSDSFLKEDFDDEGTENKQEQQNVPHVKCLFGDGDNVTDGGYQTGSIEFSEENSWDTMHLFASTPTKKKL